MSMVYAPRLAAGKMHYGRRTNGVLGLTLSGNIVSPSLDLPGDAQKRYRGWVETWPTVGTLQFGEDGYGLWSGLPDGSHTFESLLFENGVELNGKILITATAGQAPVIPAPPPGFWPQRRFTVRYAVADPRAEPDLSQMMPGERLLVVFDFAPFTSIQQPAIAVQRIGGDDGTTDVAPDGPSFLQGSKVLQFFVPGTPGSAYLLTCSVRDANGALLVAEGRLPVRDPS